MPFTYKKYVWPQTAQTWAGLITLYMRGSAAEHVSHLISSLVDLKDRVRTCRENLDQQVIDKSIDMA